MLIVFRTDASIQIGTGHVMRCLTLADALREKGAVTLFVCRDLPGFSAQIITGRGHDLHILPAPTKPIQTSKNEPSHAGWLQVPWNKDAAQTGQAPKSFEQVDWLIVDHYAIDFRWEEQLREIARKILVVDDLADRKHECDMLIDQTLSANEASYRSLVPENCMLLLGPRYAMLRPEFAEHRDAGLARRKQTKEIAKILVAMGGTDPFNVTDIVLQGLELLEGVEVEVTVVLASSAPHLESVKQRANEMDLQAVVLSDVQNMAELMVDHDLCIGSGGMTSWERCVVGLPSLTITLADNQEPVLRELEKIGATILLGSHDSISPVDIRDGVTRVMEDMELFEKIFSVAQKICDGQGIKHLVSSIYANSISLRSATSDDCRMYWDWANETTVREQAFSQGLIPYPEHKKWFLDKIDNPNSFLFVARLIDGTNLGQIRFDCEDSVAKIDISVDKNFRKFGLGKVLLKQGIELVKTMRNSLKFKSEILDKNIASKNIFINNGFVEKGSNMYKHGFFYSEFYL